VLKRVGEKHLGSFFYRESHKRIAAERACQRCVGCLGVLVRNVWVAFFNRESHKRKLTDGNALG